jgi:diphthamide synthase (EF-2-diphthine--ammonia ligase)
MSGEQALTVLPARKVAGGVECVMGIDGEERTVRYLGEAVSATWAAEAGLALALMPAMRQSRTLCVTEPVSPRLLEAVPTIQDVLSNWEQRFPVYGRYRRVRVEATARAAVRRASGRGVAAFFSGGADSFYTLLRHRDEIDALIFVHGFDFPPGDGALARTIADGIRRAAADLGKPLTEVETDLRGFSDPYAFWESYHGAAMASVAHLLAGRFARIYVPATLTYAHLSPLGSHPLLDPLWSTEAMELVHDGCEASRLEKLDYIAGEPAAVQWLRVCWENRGATYNCGRCEKCLRTMVALHALGRLGEFTAFPDVVDPVAVARVNLPEVAYTWEASMRMLHQKGTDPALVRVLQHRLYSTRARLLTKARRYGGAVLNRARAGP